MRRTGLVAAAAIVCLMASACAGVGSKIDAPDGDGEKGSESLRVSGFGADDEIANIRLDKVRKELGLKTRINQGAFDEQQFLAAVAANKPPDIVNIGRDSVGSYAARGALRPLDECIAKENIDTSQYREQALSEVRYDGKLYGIPEFYDYPILIVNNRVAEQAGVDPSSIDTGSWQELVAVAGKMTKIEDGRLVRLGFDPRVPDASTLWPAIHGVQLLEDDGVTAHLDDPAMADVYANTKKLVDAQGGWTKVKSFKDSWDFFGAENPFVTDQIGAMVIEQWYLTVLAETAPSEVDITVVPIRGSDGEPVTLQLGGAWTIPKGSRNPENACKFAKAMTAPDAWIAAAKGKVSAFEKEGKYYAGTYTGNKRADETIFGEIWKPGTQGPEFAQFDAAVEAALAQQESAIEEPASPIGAQFNDAMQDALNRVLQGQQKPAPALQRAQNEVEEAAKSVR